MSWTLLPQYLSLAVFGVWVTAPSSLVHVLLICLLVFLNFNVMPGFKSYALC